MFYVINIFNFLYSFDCSDTIVFR